MLKKWSIKAKLFSLVMMHKAVNPGVGTCIYYTRCFPVRSVVGAVLEMDGSVSSWGV